MMQALFLDATEVRRLLDMPSLIEALRHGLRREIVSPARSSHVTGDRATLLLMPAWRENAAIGIKTVTVHPHASPSVQATYLLLNGHTGALRAVLDGTTLTARRTAAASALAADYLARRDAHNLLMVGTGALAPHLIEAHASIRPVKKIAVWGRNASKAEVLAAEMTSRGYPTEVAGDLCEAVAKAHIVSVATLSTTPLITADCVKRGTHIDLVGAFKPNMAEADPATFANSKVFVDTVEGALSEAGDLLQAIQVGAITPASIIGELADLCRTRLPGRTAEGDVTLYKSVGFAAQDLIAAEHAVRPDSAPFV